MSILLRILLLIYSIFSIVLSIFLVAIGINSEFASNFGLSIVSIGSRFTIILMVISLVLIISAIIFLIFAFRTSKDKKAVSKYTNIGEVKISLNSIENIALNSVERFEEMRNVKAFVSKLDDNVSIIIKTLVLASTNIPELSREVQEAVKLAVEDSSGVAVSDVKIVIEDIYSGTLPTRS
jgi:uncharacterized alkaline shock family protein YloU